MQRFLVTFFATVLVACGLAATPAAAATFDLTSATWSGGGGSKTADGDVDFISLGHAVKNSASISDVVHFTLTGKPEPLEFSLNTFGHFYNLTVSFLDTNGNSLAAIQPAFKFGTGPSGTTGDVGFQTTISSATVAMLIAANFGAIKVTGYFCSCAGYNLSLVGNAITPIPPAMLLFTSSFLGFGALTWRRRAMKKAA